MADPLHLHLLSDSTGETLEVIAKACLAQSVIARSEATKQSSGPRKEGLDCFAPLAMTGVARLWISMCKSLA